MTTRQTAPSDPSADTWSKTACILCECNCGLEVLVKERQLVKIRGDKQHPGSAGYTCEKPLRLDKYQNGAHRIDTPMRRRTDGTYEEIDWETALDEIASKLASIKERHGGDTIFFYGGGGQGNHLGGAYGRALFHAVGAQYMSSALAQEKTGEGWVDSQLYGNHTTGDFENTEVAVFIGKNPWQSHGVARARPVLREISRDPNRTMIVIDPRKSETAEIADIHLQVKPGTDAWCVSALAATIAQEGMTNNPWLDAHTTGSDDVVAVLNNIDIADYSKRCGVPEELLRIAARRIANADSAAIYEDLGVQMSPNSTLVSYLNKMLWMLTGNFAKPGGMHIHSWMFPIMGRWHPIPSETPIRAAKLRGRVGTAAMRSGAMALRKAIAVASQFGPSSDAAAITSKIALSTFFPAVAVPVAREIADILSIANGPAATPVTGARIFSGHIPCNSITEEILTDHPRRFRAMWIDSSNPVHSLSQSQRFRKAMAALELSVVVDVAMTETARCADYVLPASSQFEKYEAALFTLHFPHNSFQLRAPLMAPLAGTRPEPEIYSGIIDRLGVVDGQLIADLTKAAGVSREAFALAFFSAIKNRPQLAGLVPHLLYRTLGTTLPEGQQAAALIWGLSHLCAIAQPDGVARAGYGAPGFAQGEALFDDILTRKQGVMFTDDRYEDAWKYIQHADGKIHMAIPALLAELDRIAHVSPSYTTDEYPFVLSVGERRAFTANVIIRNPEWRRRDAEGALRISTADAKELGITTGSQVQVTTESGSAQTKVEVFDGMQLGHISLPNGFGIRYPDGQGGETETGVAPNNLTSLARRDKFFGTPWHKNVPARIEVV